VKEKHLILITILLFLGVFFMPVTDAWFEISILSGFALLHEYAREHTLTCLLPALFIAGGITVFVNKASILKYLGSQAKKHVSYGIASISGIMLAVCSCTILPLFAGIRKRGAGLGPATTFLFAGPAINIAAILLTFSVLGASIGTARIIGAITISILAGVTMALIFREKTETGEMLAEETHAKEKKSYIAYLFLALIGILVISGVSMNVFVKGTAIALLLGIILFLSLHAFKKETTNNWLRESWGFVKLIVPILFVGVFIVGFIQPLLPEHVIESLVGSNTLLANFTATIFGALMYFSTLTEIPILQALLGKGMHSGPALALLLAGPSVSLPSMLVIRNILGTKKTITYISIVILYSTIAGFVYGALL
jgi:uncharacterized protein